jgi:V/A-type H+-transporting ATPase subunit E
MSTEKIIQRIQKDTEEQIQLIMEESEKQVKAIIKKAKENAEQEAESIIRIGQLESENTKKIMVSKATQDIRRDTMNVKEEIIEQCFSEALEKLKDIPEAQYQAFVKTLIRNGKKRLGNQCSVSVSRAIDSKIAKEENVSVHGTITSIGGVILHSPDEMITIDNTFERLLSRKKDDIRIHVGKLLFPS